MPVILYYKPCIHTPGVMLMRETKYVSTRSNGRSELLLKDFEQVSEEQYVNRMTGELAYLTNLPEGESDE